MTSVDISCSFLKPFYDDQEPGTLMEENRRLREKLSAARVLIKRQNQELASLKEIASDACSVKSPTSSMMVGEEDEGHHTTTCKHRRRGSRRQMPSIGLLHSTSLPFVQDETITAKVERVIATASVQKVLKRFNYKTACNQPKSESDTASTCSLSVTAQNDDEHDTLNDSIVSGDSFTDRPFEEPSTQTLKTAPHVRGLMGGCKGILAENTRTHSDVTTKVCNTTTHSRESLAKQHGTMYPMHLSPTVPRGDSEGVTPPTRFPSALQPPALQGAEILVYPRAITLEVELHDLRDAFQRKGTYIGSIDSQTFLPDGFGTMIYENEEYVGDWEQGYYHGYGKHTNAHGDVYDGPFHYGLKQGKDNATMNFGDGRRFHGRFHADKMREGILHFTDGSWYEGLFENDKRDGFGLYSFVNGDEYEGLWKDDLMHGRGRMDWNSDSTWYNGEWEFGIMNGMGTKVDSNGNIVHQGYFYDGEPVVFAEPMYDEGDLSDDSGDDEL